jgi:hypothetical protein
MLSVLAVLRLITNSNRTAHGSAWLTIYFLFASLSGKEVGFDEPLGKAE